MEALIRPATITDLPEILEIVNYSILHTTANYNYEPQRLEDQRSLFEEKKLKDYPLLVAEFGGKSIGFSTYGKFREKIGYQYTVEHSVYVSPDYIGHGIGKQLLSELIARARAQGYHNMIGGIDASNLGSIAFHKQFGFEECGIIRQAGFKFDRWLDLLFMQLILE